jgi:hypothetical protein
MVDKAVRLLLNIAPGVGLGPNPHILGVISIFGGATNCVTT